MKKSLLSIIISLVLLTMTPGIGRTCTTFQLVDDGRIFVGNNYDWGIKEGLVIVNKRGFSKTAMPSYLDKSEVGRPAEWTSKYGSLTFNQYGRELPSGGMNEAGLVICTMTMLEKGNYPAPDDRSSIYSLQWLQYQLDNHASVKEVIDSNAQLRIRPRKGVNIHYLISDKDGHCAVIEFIDGKQVVYVDGTMPYKVLTNSPYDDSVGFKNQNKTPEPDRSKSIERFRRAVQMLEDYQSGGSTQPLDYSFEILKSVRLSVTRGAWTVRTQWSIVYDVKNFTIYFRTPDYNQVRSIDLRTMDFSCASTVKVLDVNVDSSGEVNDQFIDYTSLMNKELTANAINKTIYLPKFPEEVFESVGRYPETFICSD